MEWITILTGVLLVLLSGGLGILSWSMMKKGQFSLAILILLILGLILRVYVGSDLFLHCWDERYHALVAKNMMSHPFTPTLYDNPILDYSFKDWTNNHIWLHKQPVPLWGISLSLSIFGVNEIAVRIPSILMSTFSIYLIYYLGKEIFNSKVGFIAAFLFAINGIVIEMTSGRIATDHIDIAFMFFVLLAIVFALKFSIEKNQLFNVFCGFSIGLALLTKWLPGLIVLPVLLSFVLHRKQVKISELVFSSLLILLIVAAVVSPWQLFINSHYSNEAIWESSYNRKHIFEALEGQDAPFYYYVTKIRLLFGEVALVALMWFTIKVFKERQNWYYIGILTWFLIPFLFFSFVQTKMQGYVLLFAPAVILIVAFFFSYLRENRDRFKYRWMVNLTLFLIIALPLRFTLERVKPFQNVERRPAWRDNAIEFSKNVDGLDKVVVFNSEHPIEEMFYGDYTAYKINPPIHVKDSLIRYGYQVYIGDETGVNDLYKAN